MATAITIKYGRDGLNFTATTSLPDGTIVMGHGGTTLAAENDLIVQAKALLDALSVSLPAPKTIII